MANRLSHIIPKLLHKDQVGFLPARHAGDNTRRTIDLIHLLNKTTRPALILSLDAQKAFDWLSWPFMIATLSNYGFQGHFMAALHALYSQPSSQVQLSSYLSPSFPLSNGTRQGCPLSPLLFILCLEPLAEAICTYPDICGFSLRRRHPTDIVADFVCRRHPTDIDQPPYLPPEPPQPVKKLSSISGYKINTGKTEALPLHIPPSVLATLQQNYSYHWCPHSVKYLGINLTSSYPTLYLANCPPPTLP